MTCNNNGCEHKDGTKLDLESKSFIIDANGTNLAGLLLSGLCTDIMLPQHCDV